MHEPDVEATDAGLTSPPDHGTGGTAGNPADADPTEAPAATRGALSIPAFRALWINNVFYFLVMNAQRFALGWLVLDGLDGDERDQGIVVFALGVPALFLVLQAGSWADRLDRKKLLVGSQLGSLVMMAAIALAIETDAISITLAIALAVVAGSFGVIGQPVRSALVPILVDRDRLFNAIGVTALAMTASMILGPLLVQLVGDRFGFAAGFWFLTILLLLGCLALIPLRIPGHAPSEVPSASVWAGTLEAVRSVIADRSLNRLFLLLTVAGLTVNPAVMVSLQAHVKEELGRDAADAALPFALMGLGIAISSIVIMRKGDLANKGMWFQRAMMVGSTMTFLMGRTTEYGQLLPLTFVMGLAGGAYINMNQGLIQANTPQPLMGRVMGLFTLVNAGLLPVGALLAGWISSFIGIGTTISAAAAICLCVVITVYVTESELRRLS